MFTVSKKEMRQLIKGLDRIQLCNKRKDRYMDEKEVELMEREGKDNNELGRSTTTASRTR